MPAKVKTEHLTRILDLLAEKFNETVDRRGLNAISSEIENLGEDYLYKKIYMGIKKAKKEKKAFLSLRDEQLNQISRVLGYRGLKDLIHQLENPISDQLLSLVGCYYSYVRRNLEKGAVYRSPAKIFKQNNNSIVFELRGPKRNYRSEVEVDKGCLFLSMITEIGKKFFHVYKIGEQQSPEILQGIFSGVSTAFDPIGGRVVLIREHEDYKQLSIKEFDIVELSKSKELKERRIAEYFSKYHDNNLQIEKVRTFGLGDLGRCD